MCSISISQYNTNKIISNFFNVFLGNTESILLDVGTSIVTKDVDVPHTLETGLF